MSTDSDTNKAGSVNVGAAFEAKLVKRQQPEK